MSSQQLIGYNNLIDSATLSSDGYWSSAYPLTNVQLRELAQVAISTSGTKIYIDHGSAVTARLAWIAAHSQIDVGDNVRLQRGTTSGGSDVYDSGSVPAWPFTPQVGTRDGAYYGIPLVMAAENSARYSTLTVPAGAQIGRIFLGPAFDSEVGPTELDDDWRPPNSISTRSDNGADWVHERAEQRSEGLVYGCLTLAEGDLLDEIIYTHKIIKEVVYIPDYTDRARCQRRGFLGTLKALPKMSYPFWVHNGIAIAIDERGGAP